MAACTETAATSSVSLNNLVLLNHGRRFAHFTKQGILMANGSLDPIFRIPKKRKYEVTTEHVLSNPLDVKPCGEESSSEGLGILQVPLPTIVKDLDTAWDWMQSHRDLFSGEVTKPAFLGMKRDEQQKALRKVLGGQFSAEKDDFMFYFREDMETCLSYCVDEHGLKVNAMFNN